MNCLTREKDTAKRHEVVNQNVELVPHFVYTEFKIGVKLYALETFSGKI